LCFTVEHFGGNGLNIGPFIEKFFIGVFGKNFSLVIPTIPVNSLFYLFCPFAEQLCIGFKIQIIK
jgi:hypothetical protein